MVIKSENNPKIKWRIKQKEIIVHQRGTNNEYYQIKCEQREYEVIAIQFQRVWKNNTGKIASQYIDITPNTILILMDELTENEKNLETHYNVMEFGDKKDEIIYTNNTNQNFIKSVQNFSEHGQRNEDIFLPKTIFEHLDKSSTTYTTIEDLLNNPQPNKMATLKAYAKIAIKEKEI